MLWTRAHLYVLDGRLRFVRDGFLTCNNEYLFADSDSVNYAFIVLFRGHVVGLRYQQVSDYFGERKIRHIRLPHFHLRGMRPDRLWRADRKQSVAAGDKRSYSRRRTSKDAKEHSMANTPEEICSLFKRYMADGDLEALLNLYDTNAVFLNQAGETKQGRDEIRQELAPLAASKAAFDFTIRQVIYAGEIALMHTDWKVSSPRQMSAYAIEVARRQPDGTWRWLIGDPFTVGRRTNS